MNLLASFFIKNTKLTVVLSFLVLIFGIQGLKKMNSESFPAVDFAMATVETFYRGASADDIEAKITKPIEDEIRSVTGIKDVRSVSQPGRSFIFIRADIDNVNVEQVMSDLEKAIDRVSTLPTDLQDAPKFTELKSEEFPVIQISILGDNQNRFRDLVADELKTDIEDNKNVLRVDLHGYKERQFVIKLNKNKMDNLHIGVSEVMQKVQLRNVNIPGGDLKDNVYQKLVRIDGKINNAFELENIAIRSNFSGQQILLKDIATVVDHEEEPRILTRYNGQESTNIIINKKAGVDTLKLVGDIQLKINAFEKKYKDKIKFCIYHNESTRVLAKLDVLKENAMWGFIFVLFFLFVFLPLRISAVASLSLPLSIMGTFGFMYYWGMNLDTISVLALVIAIGMLVDNSVIISENFARLRQDGLSPHESARITIKTLWLPISATVFTTIAAFLPMLVTRGIMGQFIKYIPIIVSAALLFSLIESFFLLPVRLVSFASKVDVTTSGNHKRSWFHAQIADRFEKLVLVLVQNRYWTMLGFVGILFISGTFLKLNKFILFPNEQTENYFIRVEMPKGTRLEATHLKLEEISTKVRETLQENIDHITALAGTSNMGMGDSKGEDGNNQAIITLYASDYAKYNVPHIQILDKLKALKFSGIQKITYEARLHGPPVGDAINATLRSNNIDSLNTVIDKIIEKLAKINGIQNLKINDVRGNDEVFVDIDYQKASRLNLDVKQIGDSISAAVSGKVLSNVTLNNKKIDLMIRFDEDYKKNLEDLKKITIMTPLGELVPLEKVANFHVQEGTPHIHRFDYKRAKTLTGSIDDRIITSIVANQHLSSIFNEAIQSNPDVSLVFGGEEESTKDSMTSLKDALILSLLGITALLVFMFGSFLRPLIIMTTIPLGLFGFSISFYLHDRPMSFLALIGMIGLGGIIVNSGIILISFIDEMRKESDLPFEVILAKASAIRLRAVCVTSLTAVAGLFPTAYGWGGADAMLIPMTLAMAWGLTCATILTLLWIPPAYAIIEDFILLLHKTVKGIFPNKPVQIVSHTTIPLKAPEERISQ
ncbi:MAG: hypothetical protein A2202_04290 [Bdellovibrionales bacterium RIFOXYA1_FULL_36_14]|nr:MAG: hypothetical protein A2202_04290 [Bdellovibrionales bacterium RIFOXYA1_FULL_36_14]